MTPAASESAPAHLPRHLRHRTCLVCRTPIDIHQEVRGGLCASPQCRRQHSARVAAQRQRDEHAAVTTAAKAHRQRVAANAGIAHSDAIPLALIQHYRQPLVPLPTRRHRQFRLHLSDIIRQAFGQKLDTVSLSAMEAELEAAVNESPEPSVVPSVCATCRGHCCRTGGVRAYLDVAVMRSFIAQHPGMRPSAVRKAYLERLPQRSFEESCVYHGANGCTLPRSMRSALCNTYFCDGLKALRNELGGTNPEHVLVITSTGTTLKHSELLKVSGPTIRKQSTRKWITPPPLPPKAACRCNR